MTEEGPRARSWAAPAAAVLAFAAIVPLLSRELGTLGGDNAEYVLLAKSLSHFDGYASGWYPGPKVPHTQYPPLFPILLMPFVGAAPESFLPCHIMVALFGAGAVYLLARLFERRGLPPWAAAAGALAPALSLFWLQTACEVLSEMPFLFFVAATLFLLEPGTEERLPTKRIVGAAVCAGLAFYTRTAGLALVIPVAVSISVDRRTKGKTAWIAAGSVVAACSLWFVYGALAGSKGGYADQLTADSGNLFERGWNGFLRMYFPNTPAFVFPHAGKVWDWAGWGLWAMAAFAIVQGFLRRRCLAVTEMFLLAYVAMQSAWPFSDPRFAIPMAALLVLFTVEVIHFIASWLKWRAAPIAVVAAVLLVLPNSQWYFSRLLPRAHRERPVGAPGDHEPARVPRTWNWSDDQYRQAALPLASYLHACDEVRSNALPSGPLPDGTILASNPRVAACLCNRKSDSMVERLQWHTGPPWTPMDVIWLHGSRLVLLDQFAGEESATIRQFRVERSSSLDSLLTLPGGVELLQVRR